MGATEAPRRLHGRYGASVETWSMEPPCVAVLPWSCHGAAMGTEGAAMGIAMEAPWQLHGGSMGTAMGTAMGTSMEPPWTLSFRRIYKIRMIYIVVLQIQRTVVSIDLRR